MTTNQQIVETLIKAKEIIGTPDKWTKGARAKDIDGNSADSESEDATCFCALGAVERIGSRIAECWTLLNGSLGNDVCVPDFNDNPDTTHADVMALFDRAIERARGD